MLSESRAMSQGRRSGRMPAPRTEHRVAHRQRLVPAQQLILRHRKRRAVRQEHEVLVRAPELQRHWRVHLEHLPHRRLH
uniref:HPL n=1 Tax=Arundo donax TaxID=35708 RepID=A0A0A9C111_ARUDO